MPMPVHLDPHVLCPPPHRRSPTVGSSVHDSSLQDYWIPLQFGPDGEVRQFEEFVEEFKLELQ